jgi:hypothetical protein
VELGCRRQRSWTGSGHRIVLPCASGVTPSG